MTKKGDPFRRYGGGNQAELQLELRRQVLMSIFQRSNTIYVGRRIDMVTSTNERTASTDGKKIVFSQRLIDDILNSGSLASFVKFKGLNYHEVSHIMYSPRLNSTMVTRICQRTNGTLALKILEDQRIEMWFTTKHTNAIPYFVETFRSLILDNPKRTPEYGLLIYGRKFLGKKARRQAKQAFVKLYDIELWNRATEIIDAYLPLSVARHEFKMEGLVYEFADVLNSLATFPNNENMTCKIDPTKMGGLQLDDKKVSAQIVNQTISSSEEDDDDNEATASGDASDDMTGQGGAEGSQDAQDRPQDVTDGQDGPACQDVASSSAGTGSSDASNDAPDDPYDLPDYGDAFAQDKADLMRQFNSAYESAQFDARNLPKANYVTSTVDQIWISTARRITDALRVIRNDSEPETVFGTANGRVNVRRFLSRKPNSTDVFNAWQPGSEDALGIEVVMLIDRSGSMTHIMGQVMQAAWALKRSLDVVESSTTVVGFNTYSEVIFETKEKAKINTYRNINASGGTDPGNALHIAKRIFATSTKPSKVLFMLTDGQWEKIDENEQLVSDLSQSGVVTTLFGFSGAVGYYGNHKFAVAQDVDGPAEMLTIIGKTIANILSKQRLAN